MYFKKTVMKKIFQKIAFSALLIPTSLFNLNAQTHYVFPADENYQSYGRVIDIMEIEPNVLALQKLKMGKDYSFQNANLSLFHLKTEKQSENIVLTEFESYRGGFGKLKDNSIVLNTINENKEYELKNFSYNAAEFKFVSEGIIKGAFVGIPGGMSPLRKNGFVYAVSFPHKETGKLCNQLFKLNTDASLGIYKTGQDVFQISILMKPHFLEGMNSHFTPVSNPDCLTFSYQVATNNEDKTIALIIHGNDKDSKPYKIISYTPELQEEWKLEFEDLSFGFKPIAYASGNTWFLTTFSSDSKGKVTTTVQQYSGKNKTSVTNYFPEFEANGSLILSNGDLCIYGFKSTLQNEIHPMFYVLNPKTLEVKKSWTLSKEDKPCAEISKIAGQEILLPGKFYTAAQLSDGSVAFGGHLVSNTIVYNPKTNASLTFNYLMVMPATFF
jgi:hypothetical protein